MVTSTEVVDKEIKLLELLLQKTVSQKLHWTWDEHIKGFTARGLHVNVGISIGQGQDMAELWLSTESGTVIIAGHLPEACQELLNAIKDRYEFKIKALDALLKHLDTL